MVTRRGPLPENNQGLCRNKPLVDLSHMRKHYTYITKNKTIVVTAVSMLNAKLYVSFSGLEKTT
jgi:hypothetical protein